MMTPMDIINRIADFDRKCSEREHTDTGEAWELLHAIREDLRQREAATLTLYVVCEGGLVQQLCYRGPLPTHIDVVVIDYDTEGAHNTLELLDGFTATIDHPHVSAIDPAIAEIIDEALKEED